MTKFLMLLSFFIVSSPLFALDKNGDFESKKERDEYIVLTLRKMAMEMNAQVPIKMDSETQLSSVVALDKTINFTMRLSNMRSEEVNVKELKKYVWGNVNDIACKSKITRILIDLGVSYVYIYFGNDDRLITRVVLNKYKCNK